MKGVLWRVAKLLSYIQDARCLKVKTIPEQRKSRAMDQTYFGSGCSSSDKMSATR